MNKILDNKKTISTVIIHKRQNAHCTLHRAKDDGLEKKQKQRYSSLTWKGNWKGLGRQMEGGNWMTEVPGRRVGEVQSWVWGKAGWAVWPHGHEK